MGLLSGIRVLLTPLRLLIVGVLVIGLPLFVYLAFIADEPVFKPAHDVDLGRQAHAAIAADADEYPLLARDAYPEAYAHLQRIVDTVLSSPDVRYRDLFAYDRIQIIDDDVLNAFCTPGGFIYVYTGLIRYLDAEDHLAGVLGHEIAHAELRHSSLRLQKEFGVRRLLEFAVLTQPLSVGDVANAAIIKELTGLSYGRSQEAAADEFSVMYLSNSQYACDGAAGFFEKLLASDDNVEIPEFLSDHPDSAARVRDIRGKAQEVRCTTAIGDQSEWRDLQASLPGMPEDVDAAGSDTTNGTDK
jgi:predicted Zn-dependent protease